MKNKLHSKQVKTKTTLGTSEAVFLYIFLFVLRFQVIGKVSIRTVPNMTVAHVEKCLKDHLHKVHKEIGSKNTLKVKMLHAGEHWLGDPNNFNFRAAIRLDFLKLNTIFLYNLFA